MRIIADENIPYVAEAFRSLGEVRTISGRAMNAEAVKDTDIVLVRSVTPVDEKLLADSRVKFVGTATIGTDHIDLAWLAKRGIGFAAAPGSNANSVAEYISAALLVLGRERGFKLRAKTIGVIGVGNVGSRVVAKARVLGMKVLMNDPPRAENPADPDRREFVGLDELLAAKPDVVTFHVPLEKGGKYPTWHLVDGEFLKKLREGCILINSSRGAVHETAAVHRAIDSGKLGETVLDVWEGEPKIDAGLLAKVDIGTPHIAGYSFDGKVDGTRMIYRAACEQFGRKATWEPILPAPPRGHLAIDGAGKDGEEVLREAVLTVYDIEADDARMRTLTEMGAEQVGPAFDKLRKEYPVRREFYNTTIELRGGDATTADALKGLGFRVREG